MRPFGAWDKIVAAIILAAFLAAIVALARWSGSSWNDIVELLLFGRRY